MSNRYVTVVCLLLLSLASAHCSSSMAGDPPKAEYDGSGRLRTLDFDVNGNGRNDATAAAG